jgi:uncharacterized membrane protein
MNQCSVKGKTSVAPSACAWPIDWVLGLVCLAAFALVWWNTVSPITSLHDKFWPEAVLLVAATTATLSSYSRTLPFQNVFWAAIVIGVIGTIAGAIGVLTGFPFGSFVYTDAAGPKFFGTVPLSVPMLWILLIFTSRGTARLVLKPWRQAKLYGIWMIGLTALLSLVLILGLDPFASGLKRYWIWKSVDHFPIWNGTPIVSFSGYLAVTLVILAFVTPMWLNKKPGTEPKEFGTLGVWTILNILSATVAAQKQFWPGFVVTVGCTAIILLLVFSPGRKTRLQAQS